METWKDIIGCEGSYQISNTGKIKSLARTVVAGFATQNLPERLVKVRLTKNRYANICLLGKTLTMHRLMAIHFIPNPNNYRCVNHKNNDKHDFSLENLEWCDHSYNTRYSYKTGTHKLKMSGEQVDYIMKSDKTIYQLADELGISKSQVHNIRTNKVYSYK